MRRLKAKLYKLFTENNTLTWIGVLQDVVSSLNETENPTTKMRPVDVTGKNAEVVWQRIYGDEVNLVAKHRFQIGQTVRLAKEKTVFRKGYKNTYTEEIFRIKKLLFKDPPAYIIEDLAGEELDSVVYESELVAYNKPDDYFLVDHIVRSRRRGNKTEYLIRFKNYGPKFDQWVSAKDLKDVGAPVPASRPGRRKP